MTSYLQRCSGWSAAHPWRAVAAWLVFVVLCLVIGTAAGTRQATTEDYRVGEAGRAEAMAAAGGLAPHAVENVLITRPSGNLDPVAAVAAGREAVTRMSALPEVLTVAEPAVSADGTAVVVAVTMDGAELDAKSHVDRLLAQTAELSEAHPDMRIEQVGPASIGQGVDRQRSADLLRTEIVAVPVTILVLFVVFGSLLLAVVPLLLAATSIAAAIGLSMVASHVFPDAGVGTNVILLIGLAVGVDYTLFYVKREREERERGGGTLSEPAILRLATATAGRTVVLSGAAVMTSSATLYLADDVIFASLATGTIMVTAVAVLSSLTVLPAVVVLVGRRGARRRPHRGAAGRRHGLRAFGPGGPTGALARRVGRRPGTALVASVSVLLVLAVPMLGLNITDMGRETHSREIPEMLGYDRLNAAFPERIATNRVVVQAGPEQADLVVPALDGLARAVTGNAAGDRIRSSADGRTVVLDLPVPHHVGSEQARGALERLRGQEVPRLTTALPGAEIAVTGDVARYADYPQHQKERLPLIIGALLLVTFGMTVWAFGSVVLGALGVVLNLLSAAAAMGVVTAVFQPTWAEGLLDFTSTGSIGSRVPLFLLIILFGLSMDYQFFVLSRIQEAFRGGSRSAESVRIGMYRSGRVVTSASVVMVTVFASFAFLHLIEMKQIGFGLAVAVLVDAFVVRTVILPAAMFLMGPAAWWPGSRTRSPGRSGEPTPPVRTRSRT